MPPCSPRAPAEPRLRVFAWGRNYPRDGWRQSLSAARNRGTATFYRTRIFAAAREVRHALRPTHSRQNISRGVATRNEESPHGTAATRQARRTSNRARHFRFRCVVCPGYRRRTAIASSSSSSTSTTSSWRRPRARVRARPFGRPVNTATTGRARSCSRAARPPHRTRPGARQALRLSTRGRNPHVGIARLGRRPVRARVRRRQALGHHLRLTSSTPGHAESWPGRRRLCAIWSSTS